MAENIYSKGTRVWFEDKDHAWISAEVLSVTKSSDDAIKLTFVDERGKELTINTTSKEIKEGKEGLPPLRNPPLLETADDLATLSHLNEPSVLHTIRNRYAQHSIYTYSGIVLIAVNPFQRVTLYGPEIIQAYSGRKRGELEPHLFAIAEDAYTAMQKEGMGQTIIVSGESGAGKTESAKFIMRYLASVNPQDSKSKPKTKFSLDDSSEIERQILATNPILEAFGNAKTTRNDNSSRFGKYIQILFDGGQEIVGARIRTYLLERSRIVYQPLTERNYHIFYQLCAGAPSKERKDLGLDSDINKFHFLKQGGPSSTPINGVDDAEEFRATQQALSTVGISVEKQWAVFRLLAALLHLGNVKITQMRADASVDDNDPALLLATRFLGVNHAEFKKWTVKKQIQTRSEKIVTSLNAAQASVVRDSVAKFVYACMFEWLVAIVNESLAGENGDAAERAEMFIGVLDIYGFEHFQKNSFEQFSINYANEKLQQEFNSHVFKLEQEEYVKEEIKWKFIDFSDNQPCIDVIEGKLGVLALLDEESRMPSGTDASLLQKLNTQILGKAEYKAVYKKPRFGNSAFTIAHYALDVTYEIEGFLEKNRDTVPDEQMALLASTKNPFLKEVLDAALNSAKGVDGPQPVSPAFSDSGSGGSRRSSVIPDPGRQSFVAHSNTGSLAKRPGAMNKKPTQGSIFKASLIALMETLSETNVHYIRCIKPNELKKPWEFQPQQVLGQLRACGVLETIRISCAGYPTRWTYEEFAERYYMLVPSSEWQPMIQTMDLRRLCSTILAKTIADPDMYQNGLTKIFFRAGMLAALESFRSDRLNAMVTVVQKNVRRRLAMNRYRQLRRATIKIQTWWRGILARRFVENIRREASAIRLQTVIRRFGQRKRFLDIKHGVVLFQSRVRGKQARQRFAQDRTSRAATLLQSLLRGVNSRRLFRSDVRHVIYIQSCIRRRLARKELKVLKAEARSVSKFKEISYRLENKVVELTQNLQERTAERKRLQLQLAELEQQLQQWINRHEEADARAKQFQSTLQATELELSQRNDLLSAKADVEKKLEEAIAKATEKEANIHKLTEDILRQATQIEAQQRIIDTAPARNQEDNSVIMTLKNEVSSLREQLNRSNALNSLTRGSRADPPLSPTFAPALRIAEPNGHANGGGAPVQTRGHQRRHSSAGVFNLAPQDNRLSVDELMNDVKRSHASNPRAVSVAFNGEDNYLRFRANGLPDIRDFDDPAEEKIRLMQDVKRLDEDVLDGLIRGLKIPAPSLTNPSAVKEILFPANLISLVTNEMWKYGLIPESERFLANVMQTIQAHVMSFTGEDAIVPGIFWLSNVHEMLSFICVAESDMLQGIGPGEENAVRPFDWNDYERLVSVVKHDLDSLEYNIYHTWMLETKKKLSKMVIPALIESQSLPGFTTSDGGGRLFNRLLHSNSQPAFSMDDILNLLNKVWKSLKSYYMEESVVHQVVTELLKLIGVASFNDLLMRRNFASWKRAMQIQYNITRIEEWCKSHDMPEGTLQLEHLMQATKLLQLKKATPADIEIIYDVCWMLSPMQIQRMCTNYYVADYENPISPEILRVVASRVQANDRNDHLLLAPETEEVGPYELPLPREVSGLETYVPAYLNVSHLRRLAALVS
ncbi:P-loop containing nucleoside triphosphate hydrolase protein [Crassisporium funariophilum]|nr:P-loop containing nucleoside triphosphate hydrolase protein [Crassisporium funariophilum]